MGGKMRPAAVIVAAGLVYVMVQATKWAAARLLWLGLVALLLGWAGLVLYHRRKLAELRDLEAGTMGGWRRVHAHLTWPRACRSCGAVAHDWRSIRAHTDPETSACAAHLDRLEVVERAPEDEQAPAMSATATVLRRGGAGAVDTLTAADRPELESGSE